MEGHCNLTKEDEKRLSKKFLGKNTTSIQGMKTIKTVWRRMKSGPLKGYELNVCVALRGSILNKVSCSIYKNRPIVCSETPLGCAYCLQVRKALKNHE